MELYCTLSLLQQAFKRSTSRNRIYASLLESAVYVSGEEGEW